jgi:hypothetical protein
MIHIKGIEKYLSNYIVEKILSSETLSKRKTEYGYYIDFAKPYELALMKQLIDAKLYSFLPYLIADKQQYDYTQISFTLAPLRKEVLIRTLRGEWTTYAQEHFKATMLLVNNATEVSHMERRNLGATAKNLKISSNFIREIINKTKMVLYEYKQRH